MSALSPFGYNPFYSNGSSSSDSQDSPCVAINGTPLDWSGRGTSHVDFHRSEKPPLVEGRFLGYGVHGGVFETTCNGTALAWKRKFCRSKISKRERQEIEIIKRLSHRHVIQLVGTYTHGQFLGLLLWPVATSDLAVFMEAVDWLQRGLPKSDDSTEHVTMLRAVSGGLPSLATAAMAYLTRCIGCIASAVAYLHSAGVKHKDLKPSNILLSRDGLWLTDFGTASDFSVLTQSATDGGERGTPKYFAPETAAYNPSGRAADIFSLGCIFFEMITLAVGYTTEDIKALRPKNDKSFQANLETIFHWFKFERIYARESSDTFMMALVRRMLATTPEDRPSAALVEEEIGLINGFINNNGLMNNNGLSAEQSTSLCGACCDLVLNTPSTNAFPPFMERPPHDTYWRGEMTVFIGNTYAFQRPKHTYTFFINLSRPDLVETVHLFLHQSCRDSRVTISQPPYHLPRQGWGAFDIGAYVVLKESYFWEAPRARPVPRGRGKRMLPLIWSLRFGGSGASTSFNFTVTGT